jgi:alkanesulfonate monooxygenase SsuD/methylene tetrahydromethanopterin reductase-like flavin-dependent oxidoreductase (luciferase family)
MWGDSEAGYDGPRRSVTPSWAWPKPATSVPILLGCSPTGRGFAEIAAWADGWMPVCFKPEMMDLWLPQLREQWEAAGRSGSPIIWVLHHARGFDQDTLRANLEAFVAQGVDHIMLDVDTGTSDELLPLIDRYAAALEGTGAS